MKITGVGNTSSVVSVVPVVPPTPAQVPASASKSVTSVAPAPKASAPRMDITPPPQATYTRKQAAGEVKPSPQDMMLSRMAEKIITKQYSEGNEFYKLLYGHIALRLDPSLLFQGDSAAKQMAENALQAVGQEAPFSAESTASHIVQFVNDLAAGDAAKTERYRAAVQDAFAKLARMSGGELPELTAKTYEAVITGLAPSGGTGAAAPSPAPLSAE